MEETNMNENLDSILTMISADENQVDNGDFATEAGSSNRPVEVSKEEIDSLLNQMSKEEQDTLFNNTNNTEVLALCAKAPHAAKYVVDEMGINELECETRVEGFFGKKLPINVPAKPSYPWDGYALRLPDGKTIYVPQHNILNWLMTNTVGRVAGGEDKKAIYVAQSSKSSSLNSKKQPFTVKRVGLTAHDPDHIIETFEKDTEADGTLKTTTRTISLSAGNVTDEAGKKLSLRGKVKDFPVFRRKEEFVESLGTIGGRESKTGRIQPGVDREKAFEEYLRMVVIGRAADVI